MKTERRWADIPCNRDFYKLRFIGRKSHFCGFLDTLESAFYNPINLVVCRLSTISGDYKFALIACQAIEESNYDPKPY